MRLDLHEHRTARVARVVARVEALARSVDITRKQAMILAAILVPVLLAAALAIGWTWRQPGDVDMDRNGYVAMVVGVLVTLGLGVGLMGLVFYSNRRGYDDEAMRR